MFSAIECSTSEAAPEKRFGGNSAGMRVVLYEQIDIFSLSQHEMIHALLFVTENNTVSQAIALLSHCISPYSV